MRSLLCSIALILATGTALAAPPKYGKSDGKPPRLSNDAWKDVAKTPLQTGEIDQLIAKAQAAEKVSPSARTTDEQFLRRIMLDLTGRLPLPADVTEFVSDKDSRKRDKLI